MSTNQPKHTPEPWETGRACEYSQDDKNALSISGANRNVAFHQWNRGDTELDETDFANFARIVACVNACAGLEDPAAALATVMELIQASREMVAITHFSGCIDESTRDARDNLDAASTAALALLPAPTKEWT